jgi:hypothetical protein
VPNSSSNSVQYTGALDWYTMVGSPVPCGSEADSRAFHQAVVEAIRSGEMLHSTGLDTQVRDYLLRTPGAEQLIERSLRRALALLALPGDGRRLDIHVLCAGGRHRSVAVAEELAARLRRAGYAVETEHLHIERPILT